MVLPFLLRKAGGRHVALRDEVTRLLVHDDAIGGRRSRGICHARRTGKRDGIGLLVQQRAVGLGRTIALLITEISGLLQARHLIRFGIEFGFEFIARRHQWWAGLAVLGRTLGARSHLGGSEVLDLIVLAIRDPELLSIQEAVRQPRPVWNEFQGSRRVGFHIVDFVAAFPHLQLNTLGLSALAFRRADRCPSAPA